LYNLGSSYLKSNNPNQARTCLEEALFLSKEISKKTGAKLNLKYQEKLDESIELSQKVLSLG
jgi:uncharacterized protein HemY